MKSFDIIFDARGNVVLHNVQGVEGLDCLELTRPYVNEMEDKSDPAEVILDEAATMISSDETISEDGY